MSKLLMAQAFKTLKTFTFYELITGVAVTDKSILTASKVTFRDAYNGYVIKRINAYAKIEQGINRWKFEGVNQIVWDNPATNIKEQPEGWTGYLSLGIKKATPSSIITIVDTTGALVNVDSGISLPFGSDFELNIPVINNEMDVGFNAFWSVRNNNLDANTVTLNGYCNITIEY